MKKIFLFAILFVFPFAFNVSAQSITPIDQIQGSGNTSPLVGKQIRTSGIVTAILKSGFYIQTPDADTDKDAATSEGIYVFGSESVG
ncbi:MAG: hypothetical protein ACR2HG_05255, partial [Pyrinomonadaceae bacterium]